jgi:8-oxo-dGTP pyrophosphatase MutT (NUDIX family)
MTHSIIIMSMVITTIIVTMMVSIILYYRRKSTVFPLLTFLSKKVGSLKVYAYTFRGIPVYFSLQSIANSRNVMNDNKLSDWISSIDTNKISCSRIDVNTVSMFGPNVGFVYINAHLTNAVTKKFVPGVVHITGDSVAVLMNCNIETVVGSQILLASQKRGPTGGDALELPAGMKDKNTIKGAIINEIKEETGLVIPDIDKLTSLGWYWASQGRTNEKLHLFHCNITLTKEEFHTMQETIYGKIEENESISLKFVPISEAHKIQDAKLEIALSRAIRAKCI